MLRSLLSKEAVMLKIVPHSCLKDFSDKFQLFQGVAFRVSQGGRERDHLSGLSLYQFRYVGIGMRVPNPFGQKKELLVRVEEYHYKFQAV